MFGKTADQLSQILAVLILDDKGDRIAIYYSGIARRLDVFSTEELQRAFETRIVATGRKSGVRLNQAEVLTYNDYTVLFRYLGDSSIIVIGDPATNEVLISVFAETLYDVLTSLISEKLTRALLFKRLDQVFLTMDEMIEAGCINELDKKSIISRVTMEMTTLG
ncbi:clathrin adaptor complex small protein [Gregarina niphandrodes]|uniref:Coatomer subunit zeta n=1 Tax=Gregarina niphandrodes TaxID=110365 RepID=A0A023B852_GRENI|nr:clathrin adaptor complex small protein [Gregarina niphandrodes]EZG68306.1 clathrin adaptor complex small protein [Gregarina niphandrodes]|eukprot:XP_011134592.1 clathrin adaptor complex small protein [Gregarina niphandrodes]